jgi:hypothetical protein
MHGTYGSVISTHLVGSSWVNTACCPNHRAPFRQRLSRQGSAAGWWALMRCCGGVWVRGSRAGSWGTRQPAQHAIVRQTGVIRVDTRLDREDMHCAQPVRVWMDSTECSQLGCSQGHMQPVRLWGRPVVGPLEAGPSRCSPGQVRGKECSRLSDTKAMGQVLCQAHKAWSLLLPCC